MTVLDRYIQRSIQIENCIILKYLILFINKLFGLDFMLDSKLKPYIIEANTNPCLELSCPLLERIIPHMLENAFRIALDPLFPPPTKWPASKRHLLTDITSENNRFEIIFDEILHGPDLKSLYLN